MFTCQHQLAMCKLHDCAKCEYSGREAECPYARGMADDTMPTFREGLEAYASTDVSKARFGNVRGKVEGALAMLGLSVDDKMCEMTYTRFETLLDRLSDPRREGGPLRPVTVKDYLSAFQTITHASREYVRHMRSRGRDPFRFSIPEYRPERPKKQTVSYSQARRVVVGMERWFASGCESDRSAALFLFFELFLGLRAGDVCRLKWGNIRSTPLGTMIVYTPHKTERSSGVEVSFVIDPLDLEIIRPYMGSPDEYVIPRHEDRRPRSSKPAHGEFVGMHVYLRRKVNRLISEAGIGNEYRGQKRGHAMRKFRETVDAVRLGLSESARRRGHSEAVAKRSYVGSEYSLVAD